MFGSMHKYYLHNRMYHYHIYGKLLLQIIFLTFRFVTLVCLTKKIIGSDFIVLLKKVKQECDNAEAIRHQCLGPAISIICQPYHYHI